LLLNFGEISEILAFFVAVSTAEPNPLKITEGNDTDAAPVRSA
jgi:hypothetical protein